MTQSLETIRRLQAWHAGKALPRGEVLNVHIADDEDVFIVAFLRMGGESRPWGVAYGTLADGPTVLSVPEGRNRSLIGDMISEFAPALLEFFRHPEYSDDGPGASMSLPLRQLWMPGQTHIEMLHYLAAAYARTRWERDDVDTLRALGNLANCLFIESQRPGQQSVMSATDALRRSFVFPTAPVRQGHLGHLLAWLTGGNTRNSRLEAARDAEATSVATVVQPDIERMTLQPHVSRWNTAIAEDNSGEAQKERAEIHRVLEKELLVRWNLTKEALSVLEKDSRLPNMGLASLCEDSKRIFYDAWGDPVKNEAAGANVFWPNVFTDYSSRSAGYAYQMRIYNDQKARSALVHGDRELQQEELAKGRGLICTIDTVDSVDPHWVATWTYPEMPTCKPGDGLVIAGAAACQLEVLDIDEENHTVELRPQWKRDKKDLGSLGRAPTHTQWIGKQLVLLESAPSFIGKTKADKARRRNENGNDIADLVVMRPRRHGALDDDGVVVLSGDEQ
ncbi:MAG: hypothetical protein RIR69_1343 [Actinomycetota bacterium]